MRRFAGQVFISLALLPWLAVPAPSDPATALGRLPATFTGVLPCADCQGIEFHLDLFPDGVYYLRMTYQGKEYRPSDDIGAWMESADGRTLVLRGGRDELLQFAIKDAGILNRLDLKGRPIVSVANQDLTRATTFAPIEPRTLMRGMFRYLADATQFEECLTLRKLPVLMENDYLALERAYAAQRTAPGDPMLATLEGRIAMHAATEGALRPALVVERFTGLWPGETCGAQFATERLEENYWKLVRLRHEPVAVYQNQREPHIILRAEDLRVAGSGGCNRLAGAYRFDGNRFAIETLATTRMACAEGMEQEQRFLESLRQAASWRVVGSHLELFDAHGTVSARFEARHLR
jgi:copper homeostasis protein (lipoprotein)